MKITVVALLIAILSTNTFAQSESDAEKDPGKERLGIRFGYAKTANNLDGSFGAGLDLALHWVQRIKKPVSVDFTFGAIYLGGTDKTEITQGTFHADFDNASMRIITVTIAPMLELPIGERTDVYLSTGLGLYTVSLLIDENIYEFELTNNHFGVNAGIGVFRRIFTNWFLDFNLQIHKFWTADDLDRFDPDWLYVYSRGDSDPLFWVVTTGVALRLF
ncbi:MAG: outer membrane beta-barrel protein [Candidatus Latescibacterota bacterium]|nr:MAG: outer membrane beta-barrel protein [Candidatus Latescibacterota bacterium]